MTFWDVIWEILKVGHVSAIDGSVTVLHKVSVQGHGQVSQGQQITFWLLFPFPKSEYQVENPNN